jgi:hypothetical protein
MNSLYTIYERATKFRNLSKILQKNKFWAFGLATLELKQWRYKTSAIMTIV